MEPPKSSLEDKKFHHGMPREAGQVGNAIKTTKYTALNFIPLSLFL